MKEGPPKVSKGDGEKTTQTYSNRRLEIVKEGSLKGSKEDREKHPHIPSISKTKPTSSLGQDDPSRENHEPNNLLNDPTHLNQPIPLGEPSGKHRVASPKGSHPLGSSHGSRRFEIEGVEVEEKMGRGEMREEGTVPKAHGKGKSLCKVFFGKHGRAISNTLSPGQAAVRGGWDYSTGRPSCETTTTHHGKVC